MKIKPKRNRKQYSIFEMEKYNVIETTYGRCEYIITKYNKRSPIKHNRNIIGYDEITEYVLSRSDDPDTWVYNFRNEEIIKVIDNGNELVIKPLTFNMKNKSFGYDEAASLYIILNFINHVDDNLFIQYKYKKIEEQNG